MKNVRLALAVASAFATVTTVRAQYASGVIAYDPGTGFAAGYTNAAASLGAPASGSGITPMAPPFSKSQLVSIGAGGEITLQMQTPITDDPADPYGLDFNVFANSFFVAISGSGLSAIASGSLFYHAASALVQVSSDGLDWFTLNPALAPAPGEWFPTFGNGNPQLPVNPSLASDNFAGLTLAQIEALYGGSAGGTGYDLAWAQDGAGNPANLSSANYVRIEVQSGVVDLDGISAVPEPGTVPLAGIGAGLGLVWWRRKARAEAARRATPVTPPQRPPIA
jgi:hypothetical protein